MDTDNMEERDTTSTEGEMMENAAAEEEEVEEQDEQNAKIAAAAARLCELPPIKNSEGAIVTFASIGNNDLVFCGRRNVNLGRSTPVDCGGPNGVGPQCSSCKSLQLGYGKVELLRRRFPTTVMKDDDDLSIYFIALRQSGGRFASAAQYLRQLGMHELEARFALPPAASTSEEQEELEDALDDTVVTELVEAFEITRDMAEVALLRNNNNSELAATWVLDDPQAVQRAAENRQHRGDDDYAQTARAERLEAMRAVLEMEIPEEVQTLAKSGGATDFPKRGKEVQEGEFFVAEGQHLMVKPAARDSSQQEEGVENDDGTEQSPSQHHCCYCGGQIPSIYCGAYECKNCNLCEGCVGSQAHKVTYQCPRLDNGGHVHQHPLTLNLERPGTRAVCDVRDGAGDCERNGCLWTCQECDFDSCHVCMRIAEPEGFNRRAMTVVPVDGDGNENTDDATNQSDATPHFDEVVAEREVAARWEGSYQDASPGEVIVGTGVVGTTSPEQRAVDGQARATDNRRPFREPALLTETALSEEAQAAFHRFHNDSGASFPEVSAADLTHVEDILQRSRVVDDRLTSRAICEAVAAGRVEIGGTLLLSQAFAPIQLRNTEERSSDEEAMECCVCTDKLDVRTAPDGAVGCLGGHAMHASCAADLLLGGGQCPSCRQPLFFPRVPKQEAQSAVEMAKAELSRMQQEEEERRLSELIDLSKRGLKPTLSVGDVVRVSSDVEQCGKLQMEDPRTGGWNREMAEECGQECCIAEVMEDDNGGVVAFSVRPLLRHKHQLVPFRAHRDRCPRCRCSGPSTQTGTKRCVVCASCEKCSRAAVPFCDGGGQRSIWHPSLLTLIRRAGQAAIGDEACVDKEEAAAKAAEKHLMRLRAELAAVKAAREEIKASMDKKIRPLKSSLSRHLSAASGAAVQHLTDTVSPADWHQARHLLLLARDWGDSDEAKGKRATLYAAVRAGDLDSVARTVRRHNAKKTIEAATWADAVAETHEYIVQPTAKVDLRAFPAIGAPKTGYSLDPSLRFVSSQEVLNDGAMWLQVAENSFFDQSQVDGKVTFDGKDSIKIIGARVVRGENWRSGDQDGGTGSEGTIVAAKEPGWVSVQWDSIKKTTPLRYRAGSSNCFDLKFAKPKPPPQGWLCFRPGGPGSPAIATLARSPLRCYSCGDGLMSPRLGKERFSTAKASSLQVGDLLFVAATLEPVRVAKISSDRVPNRVYCSFLTETTESRFTGESGQNEYDLDQYLIWYRHEDLVLPKGENETHIDDDATLVNGEWRTRRELVLLHGRDEAAARKAWDSATKQNISDSKEAHDEVASTFASCARGHLLHARCLQGALIAGRCCPAPGCTEPLWVPRVKREAEDADDACCRTGNEEDNTAEVEALRAANELAGHAALVATRAAEGGQSVAEDLSSAGLSALKMCPACCAGPLFNENCSDMRAHHGQCAVIALGGSSGTSPCTPNGPFRVPASDIAAKMMQLSGNQTVADVLPRCPGHNVLIMFNGCMSCGHLFTDTSWNAMPKWDPKAKSMLELDNKKRKAAALLAEQIRTEAAMLQFERDALWRHRNEERMGVVSQTNPPPAPSIPAYQVKLNLPQSTGIDMFGGEGGDY